MNWIKNFFKVILNLFKPRPKLPPVEPEVPTNDITREVVDVPPAVEVEGWTDIKIKEALDFAIQITGKFEGKGYGQISGNFDGQGMSVGMFQWNFGQGSLQSKIFDPLVVLYGKKFIDSFFPEPIFDATRKTSSVKWVEETMLTSNVRVLKPEWKKAWIRFLADKRVVEQQKEASMELATKASRYCTENKIYDLKSFCFMFDVVVQNGSLKAIDKPELDIEKYNEFINEVGGQNEDMWLSYPSDDISKILTIWAGLRANRNKWRKDVLSRKITIAHGRGIVHGDKFDINYIDKKISY